MSIQLSDYDYYLPKDYIAQYPLDERDSSRLLVLKRKENVIIHCNFKDIINYLDRGDILVLNNTKVLPARLYARKQTGGRLEILLLNKKDKRRFKCLIYPNRFKVGQHLTFIDKGITAIIVSKDEIEFNTDDSEKIYNLGNIPLPPYIKRKTEDLDEVRYQTVYASKEGSIAAPTAGLHFTSQLLDKIKAKGVNIVYLTLHIGYATFKPINCDNLALHKMEEEYFHIPLSTVKILQEAKTKGSRIIAVGTSVTRALETVSLENTTNEDITGKTNIFIYPGYKFKLIDCLITNFHLPRTTPLLLVCAFAGNDLILESYRQAIQEKYRFLSFGDCMFIM